MGFIAMVVGPRGSGKTSFCEALSVKVARSGLRILGFLQKSERNAQGVPQRLFSLSLATGESRLLASREGSEPFDFDPEVFAWMRDELELASRSPRNIIMVDEIGPLEILVGEGLRSSLDLLLSRGNPLVISLRPSLADPFADIAARVGAVKEEARIWRVEDPLRAAKDAENAASQIICHCQAMKLGHIVDLQDNKNGGSGNP